MADPIVFTRSRGVKMSKPRMIDFGGPLTPPLGGEVQYLERLGTRHAIDITLPTMPAEPLGREWSADLRQAKLYGAIASFGQDGLNVGDPGAVLVDGAGQLGSTINLKGFVAGYEMLYGQAMSLLVGGRWYLYFASAATIADGTGKMALPIFPMLRKSPANEDVVEVVDPKIQGSLSGNELVWTRLTAPYVDFGMITITEDK